MNPHRCRLLIFLFLSPLFSIYTQARIDYRTFGAIEARHIGPAVMSGRIAAIDVLNSDPRIIYVGAAAGGVWKSSNAGTTFEPIFDKHNQCIGGIAIDQNHPDTVWVGTGEPWVRNSVSAGDGIYKTRDGGKTWTNIGLPNSERINKIVINPRCSDSVYVAVLGKLWSDSKERGVYLTPDGGKSWKLILEVNERTGCADLVMDPKNPSTLYAAMWEFRRQPWSFSSGGPGSGFYKSVDAGKTWKKLTAGLPEGDLGRIAIAVAPSSPNILYATVEAKKSGIYRSMDYGETWSLRSTSGTVTYRPFYFSLLAVDPQESKRIFKPGLQLGISADSGKSWIAAAGMHSDLHALWIDPREPRHVIIGTDGGVYESFDRGSTWKHFLNLPASQFYHVAYDMQTPYNVYGGLQDNGSWVGPSIGIGGVRNRDWRNVGGGDGFNVFPDSKDPDIVYWQYQGGNMMRKHRSTGQTKEIKPYPLESDPKYRWNWNTPITFGAKSGALYLGCQFLFRSSDHGESWKKISGDLTTNDTSKLQQEKSGGLTIDNTSAENHCTIYTICESPLDAKVVWAGTDDGNLQVTKDAGKTWMNAVKNIPSLPPTTWCMKVEASAHKAGTAYAVFSGHQTGDMKSYVYKTTDYGVNWISMATSDVKGFARSIKEDPVNPQLLFLGTEFGLFLSIDGGKQWAQFTGNFPNTPVFDIEIHPREHDLILATHGRGILIVDDISPLRAMKTEILDNDVYVFPTRPITIKVPVSEQQYPGNQEFVGPNPSEAAKITYYLKERHTFGSLNVKVFGPDGKLITTLMGGKRQGINRVNWPMRMKPPRVAASPVLAGRILFGPMVQEGTYIFHVEKENQKGEVATYKGSITLIPDPREPYTKQERALQYSTVMKLYGMQGDLAYIGDAVADLQRQAEDRLKKIDSTSVVGLTMKKFVQNLDSLHQTIVARTGTLMASEERLREQVVDLYGAVSGYGGRPTQSQIDRMGVLEKRILKKKEDVDTVIKTSLGNVNTELEKSKAKPLKLMTREEFDKKESRD
ncbi:MAG: glycosyl hydrolase [bacterium]